MTAGYNIFLSFLFFTELGSLATMRAVRSVSLSYILCPGNDNVIDNKINRCYRGSNLVLNILMEK